MKEIIINVDGMVCGGCENRVQNAVKTIDGVEEVVANYQEGTVKVTASESVDENMIKEKIEDIGFDIKED